MIAEEEKSCQKDWCSFSINYKQAPVRFWNTGVRVRSAADVTPIPKVTSISNHPVSHLLDAKPDRNYEHVNTALTYLYAPPAYLRFNTL
ncbi:hypothetical protein BW716_14205 [[Flexibacter] sp. ATCC 35208]|nr:hypothetical protein BW716_14205 [[Flexibacter] sp. ATCC 35208]